MTFAQRLAQIFGWGFIIIGIAGFFASGLSMTADHTMAPRLLGIFPVNLVHNLVHLLFGVLGIIMARSAVNAVLYSRIVAVAYGLLTIMGIVPGLNTTFGLIPIHGADVLLHAFIAIAATYYGFVHRMDVTTSADTATSV